MALNISSNFSAISSGALSAMKSHQSAMGTSITRISTGSRLNSAKDGAASYVAAKQIQTDADGYNALVNSVQNGATTLNVAEQGISSILDTLRSMRELALDYSNLSDKNGDEGSALQNQFSALNSALTSLTNVTYKNTSLLSADQTFSFSTTLSNSNTQGSSGSGGAGGAGGSGSGSNNNIVYTKYIVQPGTSYLYNGNDQKIGTYNVSASTITVVDGTTAITYKLDGTNVKDNSYQMTVGYWSGRQAGTTPINFTVNSEVNTVNYTLKMTGSATGAAASYVLVNANGSTVSATVNYQSTSGLQKVVMGGVTYFTRGTSNSLYAGAENQAGSNTTLGNYTIGTNNANVSISIAAVEKRATSTTPTSATTGSGSGSGSGSTSGSTGDYNISWNNIQSLATTSVTIDNADGIKAAITNISKEEAKIGGGLAALEYISSSLQSITDAQYEAYEAIADVDMATEMTNYVKQNIYSQAAQAMIAQANQSMASILNLLQ